MGLRPVPQLIYSLYRVGLAITDWLNATPHLQSLAQLPLSPTLETSLHVSPVPPIPSHVQP
jgi:hypothetical protein